MKCLRHWDQWPHDQAPACLTIGAFDGIHLGHQALIKEAIACACAAQGSAWLLTFDPHPSRVLRPHEAPLLLTSSQHKQRLIAGLGLRGCVVQPFDRALADRSPEEFIADLQQAIPNVHTIVVGPNWRFGHRAAGDIETLRRLAAVRGFQVRVPEPVEWRGDAVSSTRIRKAVEAGQLEEAAEMLGRRFSLLGMVTSGRQVGRELGFPTANIRLQEEARPPIGVYAVLGEIDGELHQGAAYLGIRPTANGIDAEYLLEVHFFDIGLDLYGKTIEVFFLRHFRGDLRFDDFDALKQQIARDVDGVRHYFKTGH